MDRFEHHRQLGRDWVVTAFVTGAGVAVDQRQAEWFGQFAAVAAEVRLLIGGVLADGVAKDIAPLTRAAPLRDLMNRLLWLLRDSHGLTWSGILELYATDTRGEVERLLSLAAGTSRGTFLEAADHFRSALDDVFAALETHASTDVMGRHLATIFTGATLLLALIHIELVRVEGS